jgi:hypothetical protein
MNSSSDLSTISMPWQSRCSTTSSCPHAVALALGRTARRWFECLGGDHCSYFGGRAASYKLDEDEASVSVPTGVIDVEASGAEGDPTLVVVEVVPVVVVPVVELSDVTVVNDAVALAVAVLFEALVPDTATLDSWVVGVDVPVCGDVEVEETNGGAFSIYDPDGWTA